MSDSSAPQKPKPGSLRDRIAAFEKSATTTTNAPSPRPKPAAFATWKPKQASPPPSPPASRTEHVPGSSSTMSASDARESITRGASLKERMAALQNKGAFGAPPPVGPKPVVVERPKWKPPPVVQSDGADSRSEGISAIEKSISPPIAIGYEQNTGDSVQREPDPIHEITAEVANEEADPEEEERQRRAAIAARMARLGGARVGMAPPIIGKKPLVRRSTQEEHQPKTAEDNKPAEIPLHPDVSAPPEEQHHSSNQPASVLPELDIQRPGLAPPSRKSSMNTTTGVDSGHSPKIPTSMPVPAVPRRAGPPRKKPSKPTAPPPEPPKEEPTTASPVVDVVESNRVPDHEDPESILKATSQTSQVEVGALEGDSEDSSTLREPTELEKPGIVKSSESASLLPISDAHSPILQQADLPTVHTLDTSKAIEGIDELPQKPPCPSVTPPVQHAVIDVSERASGVVDHEEVEMDDLIAEPLGRKDQPSLSSNLEEVHSEPSNSDEDGYDQREAVDYDYKLGKPNDQNPLLLPPIPATHSLLEFEPASTDAPQLPVDNLVPLEQRPRPPPRRIIPSAPDGDTVEEPESDEETNDYLARSHLVIPPPKERNIYPGRNIQDEDGDGSENDVPALPVPHRRSLDMRSSRSVSGLQSDSSSELDSDHDGQPLPVLPRPTMRVVPPSQPQESPPHEDKESRNVAISISPPILLDREVMDEDEGDPIDPDIHIPSRRTSYVNLAHQESTHATLPVSGSRPLNTLSPGLQTNQPEETGVESEENTDETRRRTIAQRMARLGGIQFGAAPIPRPTSSSIQESDRVDTGSTVEDETDEPTNEEEEEERARKERIAAKLASMGGMRIGMMPMGISGMPAKETQFRDETTLSLPPNPLALSEHSRLAPQPSGQTLDNEPRTGSPITSDDGVQVEAEESEAEEVNYQDAAPEEIPPIPSRSGRPTRRQSSGDTAVSPPPPARRPPVPATPSRRMSATVPSPQATPPRRKDSSHTPQYDYVMVDQVESQEALPNRRSSVVHPARSASEVSTTAESQENISSQWELPSIPTSALEFESGADLSLSWSDAGETGLSSQLTQSASLRGKPQRQATRDKSLSVDDLIALWGRVGVQVCEVATTVFEKSKKSLIGDGTYAGFVKAVLEDVPNAAQVSIDTGEYGYLIYSQNGGVVQKRASEIMPGDIVEIHDAKFKGHKGLQTYQQAVGGSGEVVSGIVAEFEIKRSKVKVFQANQHVGQQTVELVSYRLEDLKSGTIKVYRALEGA